jgi:hypothetical protein
METMRSSWGGGNVLPGTRWSTTGIGNDLQIGRNKRNLFGLSPYLKARTSLSALFLGHQTLPIVATRLANGGRQPVKCGRRSVAGSAPP